MFPRLLNAWKRLVFPTWAAPLVLLLAALLSYGLRLSQLGFYWDDWPYLYLYHIGGAPALYRSLGVDRPLLSGLYALTLSILGASPLAWQVFGLLMRWLLGVSFWFALRQLWPQQRGGVLAAALLFTVYPGFTQQPISIVWGNAFVLYAALWLSLGLSALAARLGTPRAFWLTLLPGLALSAFAMFSTEYFFGLELLRPALVWIALAAGGLAPRRRAGQTLLAWLPYLALMLIFAGWRLFFQPSSHAGFYYLRDLTANPLLALGELAQRIALDAALALGAAWGQAFNYAPLLEQVGLELALFALGAAVLFTLALIPFERTRVEPARPSWPLESVLLGLYAFFAAGWPVWLAKLPLQMGFPWDRYTLSLSAGAALVAAGLIAWVGRSTAARALLLALLVGASAGFHNAVALDYRRDWLQARDLLWQLAWRAPSIQPGTVLLADGTGLSYFEDDSLSAPLNWLYAPASVGQKLDLMLMNIPERHSRLRYLQPGVPISKKFGDFEFVGSNDQAVVLLIQPGACLQVLDPAADAARADLSDYTRQALPLSRPELILPAAQPAVLPTAIFGAEPDRKWCYYYEQAALAVQQADWQAVKRLKAAAFDLGYKPLQASEYLVFIQAALRVSAWADAEELSLAAIQMSAGVRPALCSMWEDAAAWGSPSDLYQRTWPQFACPE